MDKVRMTSIAASITSEGIGKNAADAGSITLCDQSISPLARMMKVRAVALHVEALTHATVDVRDTPWLLYELVAVLIA